MISKDKKTAKKKVSIPRISDRTSQFKKDWKSLTQSGKHDMGRLKEAMLLLIANDGPMSKEWCDHQLKGDWADHRELHVKGDLLLIYKLDGDDEIIFVRVGSHSELF